MVEQGNLKTPSALYGDPLAGDLLVIGIRRVQPGEMDDVLEPLLEDGLRDREPLATFFGVIEPATG